MMRIRGPVFSTCNSSGRDALAVVPVFPALPSDRRVGRGSSWKSGKNKRRILTRHPIITVNSGESPRFNVLAPRIANLKRRRGFRAVASVVAGL